jgi:uncharacterized protein YfcZ (UPF0381/DUF406 family)
LDVNDDDDNINFNNDGEEIVFNNGDSSNTYTEGAEFTNSEGEKLQGDEESEYTGEEEADNIPEQPLRRSARIASRQVHFMDEEEVRHKECLHNIVMQGEVDPSHNFEYTSVEAYLMAFFMNHYNQVQRYDKCFSQQYMLEKGLKVFKEKGAAASFKEIKQQHDRICFRPLSVKSMTKAERRKAQEALMFLTEKGAKTSREEWSIMANPRENGCLKRIQQVQQLQ